MGPSVRSLAKRRLLVGQNANKSSSSSIYTQVEEERHMHTQNANQVAPAALARAVVFTTGIEASKFWIDNDERAR